MKFLTIIIIFLSSSVSAQQKYKAKRDPEARVQPAWSLVEQHNLQPIYVTHIIFSNSDIESFRFLKGEEGVKVFGSKGKKVGNVYKLNPKAEVISLDELLKIYKVKKKSCLL